MEYEHFRAHNAHVSAVHALMRRVVAGMENPELFVADDREYLARHIEDEGMTILSMRGDTVCAFLVIDFPGDREKNLGNDLGWPLEQRRASVHMDSVCVSPEHRGRGLQKALLRKGEDLAAELGYTSFLATVHPENAASLKSFLALGYVVGTTKEKYGGLPRHVLFKTVRKEMSL